MSKKAMTLFGEGGNAMANSDLFKTLLEQDKVLQGGGSGVPRISIRGGRFREIIGGEQTRVFKHDQLNVVIVNAAPLSRTYFEGTYDPTVSAPPTCWSADTKAPSPDVPEDQKQSDTCATCPMNVKGSGTGDSRACRFNQRLAVTLEGDDEQRVYQMQLPATSIFGEGKGNSLGMQAYAKLLAAHNTPSIAVVTGITFDEDAETPKLHFQPVRPLDEAELKLALAAKDSEEAAAATNMTVSLPVPHEDETPAPKPKKAAKKAAPVEDEDEDEEDDTPAPKPKKKAAKKPAPVEEDEDEDEGEEEAPAPKPKKKAAKKPAPVEEEEDEDEDEDEDEAPKKRSPKKKAPEPKSDLASIISGWDDEDDED